MTNFIKTRKESLFNQNEKQNLKLTNLIKKPVPQRDRLF